VKLASDQSEQRALASGQLELSEARGDQSEERALAVDQLELSEAVSNQSDSSPLGDGISDLLRHASWVG